ncbi:hypothetical protein BAUCODRAFT_37694 [Baudoinia panamericana UAMH 10762]|uniref:Uncharacterized protein n=1 Tax=Baudoinia panamericana (strain UAMH 10762) TaxID=717646 RepID=M2LFG1_BAUPA|nr:uncharacterized protein BAUCODRAFT_37694 [Baudoinia panamericana UAMH 10762]EMC92777.1 hypothetical protein BAUCODRAFT_37694 [Baudoinia panamericana UAMH 10762]
MSTFEGLVAPPRLLGQHRIDHTKLPHLHDIEQVINRQSHKRVPVDPSIGTMLLLHGLSNDHLQPINQVRSFDHIQSVNLASLPPAVRERKLWTLMARHRPTPTNPLPDPPTEDNEPEQPKTGDNMELFDILVLPREMRDHIYEYAVRFENIQRFGHWSYACKVPSIMHTNHQIRREAMETYLPNNIFEFRCDNERITLSKWLLSMQAMASVCGKGIEIFKDVRLHLIRNKISETLRDLKVLAHLLRTSATRAVVVKTGNTLRPNDASYRETLLDLANYKNQGYSIFVLTSQHYVRVCEAIDAILRLGMEACRLKVSQNRLEAQLEDEVKWQLRLRHTTSSKRDNLVRPPRP